jgi:hypothetical protein
LSVYDRQDIEVEAWRLAREEAEIAQCTFNPNTAKSQKSLEQMRKAAEKRKQEVEKLGNRVTQTS